MKVFLDDDDANGDHFGGTFPSQMAELDEQTVAQFELHKVLERFGKALVRQYQGKKTRSGARVVGINLLGIDFTFITKPEKK